MKVLITAPYFFPLPIKYQKILEKYDIEYDVIKVTEKCFESDLIPIIQNYDGAIIGDDQFSEKVLNKASNLKVLAKWGTGIDSINLKVAKNKNIKVLNTKDAFIAPVSQTVFAYILSFVRNLHSQDRLMKNNKWKKLNSTVLSENSLGVIGLGSIGKEVLKIAKSFDMSLFGCDTTEVSQDFINETGVNMVSKEALLEKSDFVSLHCDLNKKTRHIISSIDLKLMKSSAVIINTARGPLIKEKDLVRALNSKTIFGAGLAVFENEPLDQNSQLRGMENVLLTPHNSNSSSTVREYVHENTMNNLLLGLGLVKNV